MLQDRFEQGLGQHGRTRLFEHFLFVTLHAAITDSKYLGGAVGIAQQLNLDVAQRGNVLLEIYIAAAECAARFDDHPMKQFVELGSRFNYLNAFATPAMDSLDEHRIADLLGNPRRPLRIR